MPTDVGSRKRRVFRRFISSARSRATRSPCSVRSRADAAVGAARAAMLDSGRAGRIGLRCPAHQPLKPRRLQSWHFQRALVSREVSGGVPGSAPPPTVEPRAAGSWRTSAALVARTPPALPTAAASRSGRRRPTSAAAAGRSSGRRSSARNLHHSEPRGSGHPASYRNGYALCPSFEPHPSQTRGRRGGRVACSRSGSAVVPAAVCAGLAQPAAARPCSASQPLPTG